uniref:Cyclin-J-like protein n=1 Tax=Cyprinus carpio TaxID=7962 RepID=A0A8C2BNS9_CYPCA
MHAHEPCTNLISQNCHGRELSFGFCNSPQLSLRRYFADLIAIVSNRFKLCPAARHLAVYLLDLFMDRYDISVQQLHMVALSCLLLASKSHAPVIVIFSIRNHFYYPGKFEEREDRVPKLETLNSLGCMSSMNLVLTKQGLLHMELLLLETFQWNLYLPTAAHFIEYYLPVAVNEMDLHDGWPMVCMEKTMLYMSKYADYFLEVSLQDHAFLRFVPSLVAAACVAASRVILRLSPTWPPRLQRLSAYTWEQLLPCVERLLIKQAEMPSAECSAWTDDVSRPRSECVLASVHAAAKHAIHAAELPASGSVFSRSCDISDTYGANAGLHGPSARPHADTEHGCQGEHAQQGLPGELTVPLYRSLLRQVMKPHRKASDRLHCTGESLYS